MLAIYQKKDYPGGGYMDNNAAVYAVGSGNYRFDSLLADTVN